MTDKTDSDERLLEVCMHDLRAARDVAIRALPQLAESAGTDLAALVRIIHKDYTLEIEQLSDLGAPVEGAANLWMAGIADDALRDTRTVCPGRLLDAAIVGAVRKALAADEVSLKTAQVVARALDARTAATGLQDMRRRNRKSDARLVELLEGLYRNEAGEPAAP